MSDIRIAPIEIEVPGRGLVNLDAHRVEQAVNEYDERLHFGFNPENRDWVVYIKYPRDFEGAPYNIDGSPAMPILGVGDSIPAPHTVVARLEQMDTWKRSADYAAYHTAQHEKLMKERKDKQDSENEEIAERVEHALRSEGQYTGTTKIFLSGRRKKYRYNVGRRN